MLRVRFPSQTLIVRESKRENGSSVVRTLPKVEDNLHKPTFKVVIKSEYMLTACKEVFQTLPGISWTAEPLEVG